MSTPRIKFTTADGRVVMDRTTHAWLLEDDDKEAIENVINTDARMRGFKVISYDVHPDLIDVIVGWLP